MSKIMADSYEFEDADSSCVDDFMNLLSKIGENNTVSFVYAMGRKETFEQLKKHGNIQFYHAEREEDIVPLTMDVLKDI